MKVCISCGMPMIAISDYPLFNLSKPYCKGCAYDDGRMISFEEKWHRLTLHYIKHHQLHYAIARKNAYVALKKLPAWKTPK